MPSPLAPEMIEKLRRGFPLELDAMGRLRFEGDEITHPRVVAFFRDAFDVNDEGVPIVRFEGQWTYLNPKDCVFRVSGVVGQAPTPPQLRLDDGRVVDFDHQSLTEDSPGGLRALVSTRSGAGQLWARFTNRATMGLEPWLDLQGEAPQLCVNEARYSVAQAQGLGSAGSKLSWSSGSDNLRT